MTKQSKPKTRKTDIDPRFLRMIAALLRVAATALEDVAAGRPPLAIDAAAAQARS